MRKTFGFLLLFLVLIIIAYFLIMYTFGFQHCKGFSCYFYKYNPTLNAILLFVSAMFLFSNPDGVVSPAKKTSQLIAISLLSICIISPIIYILFQDWDNGNKLLRDYDLAVALSTFAILGSFCSILSLDTDKNNQQDQ